MTLNFLKVFEVQIFDFGQNTRKMEYSEEEKKQLSQNCCHKMFTIVKTNKMLKFVFSHHVHNEFIQTHIIWSKFYQSIGPFTDYHSTYFLIQKRLFRMTPQDVR